MLVPLFSMLGPDTGREKLCARTKVNYLIAAPLRPGPFIKDEN